VPQELSERARESTLRVARAMFPHDALPDEAYAKVVNALAADARSDDGIHATLEGGLEGAGDFGALSADEQLAALEAAQDSAYFKLLQAKAVVELYDNPLVWKAFGYEGPSTHLGGYVNRGFDDLDWLPDPPLAIDPTAGSHHS
jgi:hypothetical protein